MLCNDVILNACENSKLTLNYYAVSVRVLNYWPESFPWLPWQPHGST